MNGSIQQKTENILKFRDLLPGIINRLPRIPALFKAVRAMQTIDMEDSHSLGKLMETNALRFPGKRALLYEDQVFTHKELNEHINRYANFLHSEGIQKGDVVGVFLENRSETNKGKNYNE